MAITGIFNILATPFDEQRQVDWASLRRLVEFQLDKGAHGLTILGVLGEAAKLSVDESPGACRWSWGPVTRRPRRSSASAGLPSKREPPG